MIRLNKKQRSELEKLVARSAERADVVRRVHVVLWSADGVSGAEKDRRTIIRLVNSLVAAKAAL